MKVEGTLELERAQDTVTITREKDTRIPHIQAKDLTGCIYGQGFANAQSRLWQMELMRRAAQGKLSEAFGDGQLRHDKLMRSIGLVEASQASLETLSQDVRDGL